MVEKTKHFRGRRHKKIIAAAWLYFFPTVTAAKYDCKSCNWKDKKEKGCKRPTRSHQLVFECAICGGENKKCLHCKGKNEIRLKRCPRAIITADVLYLLPYFQIYRQTGLPETFPDGRTRLYQPKKLLNLFALWSNLYKQIEVKQNKNGQ
jgi:hypothetical protein